MKQLINKILLRINYILVGVLILSYLSVKVSPDKIWFFAFLGLIYPYLLVANLVFVFIWFFRKRKYMFISLIAIVIGWNYLSKIFQIRLFHEKRKKQNTTLVSHSKVQYPVFKLLSYNVRAFNKYNWAKNEDAGFQIFDLIKQENPQIICFQEYYTNKTGVLSDTDLKERLPGTPYSYVKYIEGNSAGFGIAIYSAYPIVNMGYLQFENTLNFTAYVDIAYYSDTVRIYNNHLQSVKLVQENYHFLDSIKLVYNEKQINGIKDISYRMKNAYIKRAYQADIISSHIKTSPYPVIVCGDFNDTPISYTYQKMKNGLSDAFIEAGSGFGKTYIRRFPSFRIDYILHSKKIKSLYYRTLRINFSDHYPITCYFYL